MTSQLKPNQALAYINVVESNIILIIYTQTTCISATIIEYDKYDHRLLIFIVGGTIETSCVGF